MSAARRHFACRAAALVAAMVLAGGCTATLDNDYEWLASKHRDRWYTAGARFERPVAVADDDSLTGLLDRLVLDVAQALPSAGAGEPGDFSTASGVLGLQMYTPEDTDASQPILDDRPYAGWVYAGVLRRDTHLDPDPLRRHDVQSTVELDIGLVGPAAHVDDVQSATHNIFGGDKAHGWSNQLEDEPGVILRAVRQWRSDYALLDPESGLAWDISPHIDGAMGNIDTHVGAGSSARLGLNLSRALDPIVGDVTVLLPNGRHVEPPSSLFLFIDLDTRFVIHNLFLHGNTFKDSQHVTTERFVGEGAFGIGWEKGPWRIAYSKHLRTEEFTDQRDDEVYASLTVSWTPRL